MSERLQVLTTTTLFPSSVSPRHGIFVCTRLARLRACTPTDIHVVAPVPWFPFKANCFGRYAEFAATPKQETIHAFDIQHPRYMTLPRVGMALQPRSLGTTFLRAAQRIAQQGRRIDVIDAHYFYPDGVAAAYVASHLKRPFVITARGSDINVIAQMPGPRRAIVRAAAAAARVIAVSSALKEAMVALGIAEQHIEVLRNGVDAECFAPNEAEARRVRQQLNIGSAPMVLSVGNLVSGKGHDLVLRAVAHLSDVYAVIVGQGPERHALGALAQQLGINGRVRFIDNMPQHALAAYYSAAQSLALGSQREGWPNVLLEAMACGTPVVSTAVGAAPEIVANDGVGRIVFTRSDEDFAQALAVVLAQPLDRAAIRAYATDFDWDSIAQRYHQVLQRAAAS